MDAHFWHQKWDNDDIGFHRSEANPLLVRYFQELHLEVGGRVFLPLCGKTRDIAWLLSNGYRVAGAELSEIAIKQLFADLGITPSISTLAQTKHYSAPDIDIFVGDLFDLSADVLGSVDAIYDRAALVALPGMLRNQYTLHLTEITDKAPQLVICYEYDQTLIEGPPFSIRHEDVHRHYEGCYDLTLVASVDVPDGMKGKCAAQEHVWLLRRGT